MWLCTSVKWLEQSNIFTKTWFSSDQRYFIPKFLGDFYDKIRRAHTGLELCEEKLNLFVGERFHISFIHIYIYIYMWQFLYIFICNKCTHLYILNKKHNIITKYVNMNVSGIPVRKSWSKVCKLTRLYVNFARWFVQGFLDSGNIY